MTINTVTSDASVNIVSGTFSVAAAATFHEDLGLSGGEMIGAGDVTIATVHLDRGHHVGHRQDDHRRHRVRYDDAHQRLLVVVDALKMQAKPRSMLVPAAVVGDSTSGGTISILAGGMFTWTTRLASRTTTLARACSIGNDSVHRNQHVFVAPPQQRQRRMCRREDYCSRAVGVFRETSTLLGDVGLGGGTYTINNGTSISGTGRLVAVSGRTRH